MVNGRKHARASQREPTPTIQPPRIGLALSSGGARGFAHVGVIKALQSAGFQIAAVAGSSIGSIIASGYAAQADSAALEAWVLDFRAQRLSRPVLPVMDPTQFMPYLDGLLNGATFADCAVPLQIVATDLRARAAATLNEGSVALAAVASSAVPFLHRPVRWQGRLLADGALSCVLPLQQAQMGNVDLVIGSLVSSPRRILNSTLHNLGSRTGRVLRGWSRAYAEFFREHTAAAAWAIEPDRLAVPTFVLEPALAGVGPLDFRQVRAAIAAGEAAVAAHLDELWALCQRRLTEPGLHSGS